MIHRYKDGVEVQPSDCSNITVQAEGAMRRLIIRSADASDAGVYACKAGGNAMEFTVNVRGMFRSTPLTIFTGRPFCTLTCALTVERQQIYKLQAL